LQTTESHELCVCRKQYNAIAVLGELMKVRMQRNKTSGIVCVANHKIHGLAGKLPEKPNAKQHNLNNMCVVNNKLHGLLSKTTNAKQQNLKLVCVVNHKVHGLSRTLQKKHEAKQRNLKTYLHHEPEISWPFGQH